MASPQSSIRTRPFWGAGLMQCSSQHDFIMRHKGLSTEGGFANLFQATFKAHRKALNGIDIENINVNPWVIDKKHKPSTLYQPKWSQLEWRVSSRSPIHISTPWDVIVPHSTYRNFRPSFWEWVLPRKNELQWTSDLEYPLEPFGGIHHHDKFSYRVVTEGW